MRMRSIFVLAVCVSGLLASAETELHGASEAFSWSEETSLDQLAKDDAHVMVRDKCDYKGSGQVVPKAMAIPDILALIEAKPGESVASTKVPSGWCLELFAKKNFKGEFLKVHGPSNIKCLDSFKLQDGSTWKGMAMSVKVSKCKALSTKQKKANKAKESAAAVAAATTKVYTKGGTLASITKAALSSATSGADSGSVTTGYKASGTAAAAAGLPATKKAKAAAKFENTALAKGMTHAPSPPIKLGLAKHAGAYLAAGSASANVGESWYKYAKSGDKAWKKFVMPYPKADKVRRMPKALFPDDDSEDFKKQALNSLKKDRIDGGYNAGQNHKTAGSVANQASLGPKGHYYIGRRRRRIGAGFGRRRRTPVKVVPGSMPNVGITSSKLTGKTIVNDKHSTKCTHITRKYKKKWPYCKKLSCFKYSSFTAAKKACLKNKSCKGFTFSADSHNQDIPHTGNGCYMAPPCRFFGTVAYDYFAKSTECVPKLHAKDLLPKHRKGKRVVHSHTSFGSSTHTAEIHHAVKHNLKKVKRSGNPSHVSVLKTLFGTPKGCFSAKRACAKVKRCHAGSAAFSKKNYGGAVKTVCGSAKGTKLFLGSQATCAHAFSSAQVKRINAAKGKRQRCGKLSMAMLSFTKGKHKFKTMKTKLAKIKDDYSWLVTSYGKTVAKGDSKSSKKANSDAGKVVTKLMGAKKFQIGWSVAHGKHSVTRTASSERQAKKLAKKAFAKKLEAMKAKWEAQQQAHLAKLANERKAKTYAKKKVLKELEKHKHKHSKGKKKSEVEPLFAEDELIDDWEQNAHLVN